MDAEKNGSAPLAAAVGEALSEADKQAKNAAAQAEMRMQQARAMAGQQRLAIATSVLSGMCAGSYAAVVKGEVETGFGERMVRDALGFADKLMLAAIQPPAANG